MKHYAPHCITAQEERAEAVLSALRTAANNVSQRQPPRPRPGTAPRPLGDSDALGTLRPVAWGTLRVKRATGPLRYADTPRESRLPGAASATSHRKIRLHKKMQMV